VSGVKFDSPRDVDGLFYDMKLNDAPRGADRARIDSLMNGAPPYTPREVEDNTIAVNVNYLEGTKLSQSARSSFASAFQVSGNFFVAKVDSGPVHKRDKWSNIVTRNVNRPMKRSLEYYESLRSKFALNVLHGIAPATWRNRDEWCPEARGIDDILIPADTLLTMRNLPFFFDYHKFTAPELIQLTSGPRVDPGWNMKLVKSCLEWIDEMTVPLRSNSWPDYWSPEKWQERIKEGGAYAGDAVPTIDCADFYFWHDDGKHRGWYRRIILDTWSSPTMTGGSYTMGRNKAKEFAYDEFLYNGKMNKYADNRQEIISFQFSDLSAVAPFRYHSVRSLGYLVFAICHLQNRLRCKFHESVLENLMMLFRVKSMEDVQRVLKLNLINRGFIDETIQFVPANERFQINAALVELGIRDNQNIIDSNASSYMPTQNYSKDNVEKTRYQVSAELNATTSLVSAAIQQAAMYYKFECMEIFRRFCNPKSQDHDVRKFRAACLKDGVPEEYLTAECWDIEPEKMMGGGNQTLQTAIAQELMQVRDKFDPSAQREILRDWTLAITQDSARADRFVPETPTISNSITAAQYAFGSLMAGGLVSPQAGLNEVEYIPALLASMASVIQGIEQTGGMTDAQTLAGLSNVSANVDEHIQILAQDPNNKAIVKQFGDQLGELNNMLKAYTQRLIEKNQSQNGGQPPIDPKTIADIQNENLKTQAKVSNMKESHANRTAERKISFEQKFQQDAAKAALDLETQRAQAEIELTKSALRPSEGQD